MKFDAFGILAGASFSLIPYGVAILLTALGAAVVALDFAGRRDERRWADAVVILGAPLMPDGSPGKILQSRVEHGADLFLMGLADLVIVTGGSDEDMFVSAARVMAEIAESRGVPREKIVLEERAANTRENAAFTAAIFKSRGLKTAIIVTCPFHMPRAVMLFRHAGIRAWGSPAFRSPAFTRWEFRAFYLLREVASLLFFFLPASIRAFLNRICGRFINKISKS